MKTWTYSGIKNINLTNLCYTVELIFDKDAKNTKVIIEGIDDLGSVTNYKIGFSLHLRQSFDNRDITGDQIRTEHPLSKVSFFEMESYKTPLQEKVPCENVYRRTARNFFKKKPVRETVAHITIICGPVDITVNNCISIVGAMQGDFEGYVQGSCYVNVDGVTNAKLRVGSSAKVRLQDVTRFDFDTQGTSNVRVNKLTKGVNARSFVDAHDSSRVIIKGETFNELTLYARSDADIYVVGDVTNSDFKTCDWSSINVDGGCETSRIDARASSQISLREGISTNQIKKELLSTVTTWQ